MHPLIQKLQTKTDELRKLGYSHEVIKIALKEVMQDYVLVALYNADSTKHLNFYGGTCLRKFFNLKRFSEDIDLETHESIDLKKIAKVIQSFFETIKFIHFDIAIQEGTLANRILLKFPVLHMVGLSQNPNEKLHVKVEINPHAKRQYKYEITPFVNDTFITVVKHYDISTLMAGKILACLERSYKKGNTGIEIKGRDFFDLIWYMEKGIIPDVERLLDQNPEYTIEKCFKLLDEKINKIKEKDLYIDLYNLSLNTEIDSKSWCQHFHLLYKTYRLKNYTP